jgi:hypothetical protein
MTEWLIGIPVFIAIVALAVVLLLRSDRRRFLQEESQRSIVDRIHDIHQNARFFVNQFERSVENVNECPELSWIPQVLEFYRRLESLAENEHSRAEDALTLAQEASQFVSAQQLKGVFVVEQAQRLAQLLQSRDEERQRKM